MTTGTADLKQVLSNGSPTLVAEYEPPTSADCGAVREAAERLKGRVDAVGIVDNRAEIRMSAIAAASVFAGEGVQPIVHVTVRDRNRIALISDVLGAQALGLGNVLCTTGDHQKLGREHAARNVFDLDTIQLLATLDGMRKDGFLFDNGRKVGKCNLCLGATASPVADPPELQAIRLAKKAGAGADFVITQPVFDVPGFQSWLGSLDGLDIVGEVPILAGILAPPTAARAREIEEKVPGVEIPEDIIRRLESAGSTGERGEAIKVAVELIGGLKGLDGVKGFCLSADGDISMIVEIIEQAGLKAQAAG